MKIVAPRFFTSLSSVILLGWSAVSALAGDEKAKLSQWELGNVLYGEKISKNELKGKVVVVEYWGVRCPPCVASLPHLAELDKKNRDKGLVIIGAESQGSSKEQIKPLLDKAKVEYTITDGAEGPIPVSGIPRAFVFDRKGELVFDGHPGGDGFDSAITKALKEDAGAAAGGGAFRTTGISTLLVPSREWTNTDGKTIRAAVKAADATNVSFLTDNGQVVSYPLEKLTEESRKVIAEALAKRSE